MLVEVEGTKSYRVLCAKLKSTCFILQTAMSCMCAGRGVYMIFYINKSNSEICNVRKTSAEMHTAVP